ncbi:MAG TPA: succinate dehydrogenase, hydrophobic membrane anchor protein [Rhodopila sp.]|uniref:succinate dehydrogenase, hydrophobic membrane anchor protein n=1 Tax=Rhodopila sp. TaxID=2480087 RepID=UPI002C25D2D2|nr:succinate dehydrogenase, hydrophobic membrane anchor protein [Rhodopila sp.]HVY18436.1 succinate dehydrogenase, hydrophobic membrane anchor protein [Rhodopila sp.]
MANPHIDIYRSPLGRARGAGAAKHGVGEWLAARIEAVALVPLTIWFIFSVIHLSGASHAQVVAWMQSPWTMALMIALVGTMFHHLQLGLQNVIEDYIHDDHIKWASLVANKAVCVLLALACIVSVLKIGL